MENKIRIHPRGTKKTDKQAVAQLQKSTPEAWGIAKKILVTATKYRKGGGIFSSKQKRGKQLENEIYLLEKALRRHRFREIQMYSEGPVNVLIVYFSMVSDAYPNWQNEYALLNDFIPNCTQYKRSSYKETYERIKEKPSREAYETGILENKFGDFIYPGEEGYEELLSERKQKPKKPKRGLLFQDAEGLIKKDIGKGYDTQRLFLKHIDNSTYEIIGLRTISTGNPVDQNIKDLTGEEVGTLIDDIEKDSAMNDFEIKAELSNPDDVLSPLKILIFTNGNQL